jgi:capsular exopolysaccharide synthesis family protein
MDNLDYMAILRGIARRHKRLIAIIFCVLAFPSLTLVYLTSRTSYVSSATIAIEPSLLDQTPLFRDLVRKDTIATYLVLLKSRSFTEGVVETLPKESFEELLSDSQYTDHVLSLTNWVKRWMGKPPTVLSPQERAVAELQNARMEFAQVPQAPGVLSIKGSASKPRVAMDLVNTHIQLLLSRTRTSNQEETRKAREFLEQQVRQIKDSLTQAEEALTRFQQEKGRLGLGSQTELDLIKLSQIENAMAEAQASRDVLSSQISDLRQALEAANAKETGGKSGNQGKEKSDGTPSAATSAEHVARFSAFKAAQDHLARLEARLAAMRERYTDAHPLVQATQDELTREQGRITQLARELPVTAPSKGQHDSQPIPSSPVERAQAQRQLEAMLTEMSVLKAKVDTLKGQSERLRRNLRSLTQEEVEYSGLRRTVEANRNLFTVLSDKLMAARIREQGETGYVRIFDPASFPFQATQSKAQRLVLMVLALAGGIAFGAAFGIEFWRLPVETESDVQKASGLAVLGATGVIANPTDGGRGNRQPNRPGLPILLPSSSAPAGIHMELYRAIRAAIEIDRLKSTFSSILVTSPGPSEGKSTTVLNLALVFQEFGRRVLVVDTDFRRPSLHRALSLPNTPGLVDFLRGTATFDQVCHSLPSGVTLIPGQIAQEDAASLLASPRGKELLKEANERFDLILVDSAPVLAVPDNLLLLTTLDRAVIVVKASATSKRDLQRAKKSLEQMNANILGVILNQANPRDVHYYHPRYSNYYSSNDGKARQECPRKSRFLLWRGKK